MTERGKSENGLGPSDVLGREIAIDIIKESIARHAAETTLLGEDDDGRAVRIVLALDRAMRNA